MKTIIYSILVTIGLFLKSQSQDIYLITRADDIGFCHAVNQACIKTYKSGIAKSVEILVPSPWFMEAAFMLKESPGFDVGVHLCLTSEWVNLKWRPLTHAPSLQNPDGYFCPFIWQNDMFPKNAGNFLLENKIDLVEVEREWRAQIEMAKKYIPNISHLSAHMGCNDSSDEIRALAKKISQEYNLPIGFPENAKSINWEVGGTITTAQAKANLIEELNALKPGIYSLVEHPGLNDPEMKSIYVKIGDKVALNRQTVTDVWTSSEVLKLIKSKNIKLISVAEAFKMK